MIVVAATLVLVFAVPRRRAGAWIGLLTLVASPNLHYFGPLFALPAMLVVRREIGLLAALSMSLSTRDGAWLGVARVTGTLLAARVEPRLLEAGCAAARRSTAARGVRPPGPGRPDATARPRR